MDMILKYARGISYSQLYKDKKDTIEMLVKDLPTCESVVWLSFLVHQKISLTVKQAEIHILIPMLFQLNSDLHHRILDFIGDKSFPTDLFFPDFDYASPILKFPTFHGQNRHFCLRLVSSGYQTRA